MPSQPSARKRNKPIPPEPTSSTLAEAAAALVSSRRRNTQSLVEAGRNSYVGLEALLKRRLGILRDTLAELRTVAKVMRHVGARASVAHVDDLARGLLELTIHSIRELSALAATTQKGALEILTRRLRDDLAEFQQMRSRRGASKPK